MRNHLLILAMLATACSDKQSKPAPEATPEPVASEAPMTPPPAATPPPGAPPTDVARASNRFALQLWTTAPAGNVAMSPASIATALTIAWGGAKGDTAAQMQKLLHLEGEADVILSRWGIMAKSLQDPSRGVKLELANRLYGEKSYPFDTTYFTLIRHAFDVWIEPVDFANDPEGMRTKINTWVADSTDQRIKNLLPPRAVDRDTRLVIVNAIYFLADWAQPFQESRTKPAEFYVNGTTAKPVPTMQQTHTFRHGSDAGASILELPYTGRSAAMYVLLPDQRDGLPALEKNLEAKFKALQGKLAEKAVSVSLPRFTIDPPAPIDLVKQLEALGMVDAFDQAKADFTNIAKPKDERDKVFIGAVLHKAFVKVDEKGTEAAAATAVAMPRGGPPPKPTEFKADHPFLFVIADRATGMILFIGRVVDPA